MGEALNLRKLALADLKRAQRLIERVGDELDPQFRIASPEGDWWIGISLSDGAAERARELSLVSRFMAWKSSPGFTQAVELIEPDAVVCIGVSHTEVVGWLSLIERNPLRFSDPLPLSRAQIGDDVPALLPRGALSLSEADVAELESWFGARGRFPAVHIQSGRVG